MKSTKETQKERTSKNTAKFLCLFIFLSQIQGKTQERQLVSAYQKTKYIRIGLKYEILIIESFLLSHSF